MNRIPWFIMLNMLRDTSVNARSPIIVVPGLGGSVLRASLRDRPKYRDCATESEEYTLFFSEAQALLRFDCWIENVALRLDSTNGTTVVRNASALQ